MDFPRHILEACVHPDPFPYYRSLREDRPLFFDESIGLWVASSHAAVSAALSHPLLRVRPALEPVPRALLGTAAGDVFSHLVRMTDGEFHAAHKPAVEQAARQWTLRDVGCAAQDAAQDLLPRLGVNDFCGALPVQAMARLLGVAPDALDQTVAWVRAFVAGIGPGASGQVIEDAVCAAQGLLGQGQAQGLDAVQCASRIAFMQQSLDACGALLGHMALMMRAHDAPRDPRAFVAEVERYCAPTQNTRRFAPCDIELSGCAIRLGQGVVVVLASANRDPALNAQPDLFDPDRAQRRSMGFGQGRHTCPGAAIGIEIVAAAWPMIPAGYFGELKGYRPLANIRAPQFG